MLILGIDTSCDETAAAVLDDEKMLSNVISSQLPIHKKFGGIVPELASRAHMRLILPVIRQALEDAGVTKEQLQGMAVTYGPGLVGALLVGLNIVKAMALTLKIPWVGINHIEGHVFAHFVNGGGPQPPFVCLLVSGGHTELMLVEDYGEYRILGRTRDDAAGEAFDKVAKMLKIGYPGGPVIDRLARKGNAKFVNFPKAHLGKGSFDFSFSGLKTAVLYYLDSVDKGFVKTHLPDIAASFQKAVVEILVEKTVEAALVYRVKRIAIAGGVAANSHLREQFKKAAMRHQFEFFVPPPVMCTDNAAMIARAGVFRLSKSQCSSFDLPAEPSLKL